MLNKVMNVVGTALNSVEKMTEYVHGDIRHLETIL
jgi:hypothetical protein